MFIFVQTLTSLFLQYNEFKTENKYISKMKGRDIYLNKNIEFKIQKETLLKQKGTLLHKGQQGKHIIGHNNYKKEAGKSIVSLSTKKIEELLQRYAGTGQVIRNNKERVDFREIIGIYINQQNGDKRKTTIGIIHYSKRGLHLIPAKPN